ncbi:SGNH/GDSL hydrolase family protein [Pengzhenrongella sp.]|jgi:lysophospholipase L1-like esterase|uniref:SGNH/GDSL hydrolase family protein n=1 Tax=Pengzhenrongella sp. TaxID=2888820 RepID=UPI002F938941
MTNRTRVLSGIASIVIAGSGVISGASTAIADTARPVSTYVALGDSFAAGQGAGDYLDACLRSENGYPALLDAVKGVNLLRNASCSGATTGDVNSTQLSALNRGTTLVTLTVGGNDLNVVGVAAACTAPVPVNCSAAIAAASALLSSGELAARLGTSVAGIAAAAPNARTLVTGYPYLLAPAAAGDPNAAMVTAINTATGALNATIAAVAGQARAAGANVRYVDVTGAFAGHGIGSAEPWINLTGPDSFHPTAAGYRAYASALVADL